MVPILCKDESHLAHLSENDCELSDYTPICEVECFHLEDMSDTPSELREVVDRSMDATWHTNNLPSITSVFSHVVGSMDDEARRSWRPSTWWMMKVPSTLMMK